MKSEVSICSRSVLVLLFLGVVLGAGCRKSQAEPVDRPGPKSCSTSAQCGADELCDQQEKVCVPKCSSDNQCPRNSGTRCDEETGACIPAETCSVDANCSTSPDHDYCDGISCICVQDASVLANDSSHTGVCRRPSRSCEPCEASAECGNGPRFVTNEAACKVFKVGDKEEGVCLPLLNRRCPPGMVAANPTQYPDLGEVCVPQGGDCAALNPCDSDADCGNPDLPVCDPIRQICIPGCNFNLQARRTEGCRPGAVCHANTRGSDPALLNSCETVPLYGLGTCDIPCLDDDECKLRDSSFVCRNDGAGNRCRPAGCIDDLECTSRGGGYDGFCDMASGECVYDACRLGVDPRRGCGSTEPFLDCSTTFKCVGDLEEGYGGCAEMDCLDQGGAEFGCLRGNFCAGEAYRDRLTGEVLDQYVQAPEGVDPGACFPMPQDLWCASSCSQDSDCLLVDGITHHASSPPVCDDFDLPEKQCFWGCEHQEECPSDWNCSSLDYEVECGFRDDGGLQLCFSDNDCAQGSRCVDPIVDGRPAEYEFEELAIKVCECTDTGSCSAGYSCNAGVATAGKVPGEPKFEEVQARYCSNSSACGSKGSCEWWGEMRYFAVGNWFSYAPAFYCAAAPVSMTMAGVEATCPARDPKNVPTRAGRALEDQYRCVYTSVCQPGFSRVLSPDPSVPNILVCESL